MIDDYGRVFVAVELKRINSQDEIPVQFDSVAFMDKARFIGEPGLRMNLKYVSFRNVDLSNVEFYNVEWGEEVRELVFFRRLKIINEDFIDDKNYGEIATIYHQLRKNYESSLRFVEAGGFFIGEMEAMRKGLWKSNRIIDKLLSLTYGLYKVIAMYGESIFLPSTWLTGIVLVFAILRYLSNNSSFTEAFLDSLFAASQFPRANTIADLMERVISFPFLGILFIALRRRFERKK